MQDGLCQRPIIDENKDPIKRKALFDAVATAVTKWDATWTAEFEKVTDRNGKLLTPVKELAK